MTTAIQTTQQNGIAPFFSPEQEKMILSSFLGDASKEEAAVLMEVARVRRLNPLLKQIHFVKRWDNQKRAEVWSFQTSIDGLRAIAERTGRYEGQTAPQWCGSDGVWRDVWLEKSPPAAARVGVYKQGFREALYGIARWETYVQTKRDGTITQFWGRMPDLMLSKCAEALALRKAFPEDMSGLYTAEEMGADEASPSLPKPAPRSEPVVVKDVEDPTPEQKRATRNVVEAAATLQAEIVPPEKPAPHNARQAKRAQMIWKRATNPNGGHNMTPGMFERWVVRELGAKVPSKEWTDEQMTTLEAALDREESLPDDQPGVQ